MHYLNSATGKPACRQPGDTASDVASVTCPECRQSIGYLYACMAIGLNRAVAELGKMTQVYLRAVIGVAQACEQDTRNRCEQIARQLTPNARKRRLP
jgi:hypothetical protein